MKGIIIAISLILSGTVLLAQKLEVDGSIKLSDSGEIMPEAGTIRWTGTDFEGWDNSKWVSFTGFDSSSTVTDADSNEYKTVMIGNQEWMAENLKTNRYNNGDLILPTNDFSGWSNLTTPAWSYYDTVPVYDDVYGKLYNYFAIADTNSRNVCPVGWHVPSNADWDILVNTLGGAGIAGEKMKSSTRWVSGENGNNLSGFNGGPGGLRNNGGMSVQFGLTANYWSSSKDLVTGLTLIRLNGSPALQILQAPSVVGFSVRCVKDQSSLH